MEQESLLTKLWSGILQLFGHGVTNNDPPWLITAYGELGTQEIQGAKDNPKIMGYYTDAGHPGVAHDEVSWCAAFTCAMLERAGYESPRTLVAREFHFCGDALRDPVPGCIVVFWRGSPSSWQGHVAFYVGPGAKLGTVRVLGGNQSDRVSIVEYPTAQVLEYRWPYKQREISYG